jgi:hypothetical protein
MTELILPISFCAPKLLKGITAIGIWLALPPKISITSSACRMLDEKNKNPTKIM